MTDLATIVRPKPADVLAGLRALRYLLADPDHWTRGVLARDAVGNETHPEDPNACQWCLIGGVGRVACDVNVSPRLTASLVAAIQSWSLAEFNDTHTHAEVLAAIDRAIAFEEVAA